MAEASNYDFYEERDYKVLIRKILQRKKGERIGRVRLSLRKVAQHLQIQYTYLSKVLNSDHHHLGEDHIFLIAQMFNLDQAETEFLLTLRSFAVAHSAERKKYLSDKISSLQNEKHLDVSLREARESALHGEAKILLDPYAHVTFIALGSPYLRKNTHLINQALGLSRPAFEKLLTTLESAGYIELGEKFQIKKVLEGRFHWGRGHPLLQAHQQMLKVVLQNKILQTEDDDKQAFMVTFTSDPVGQELIRKEFRTFIKKVEKICTRSEEPNFHRNLFQINYEFLKWI